MIDLNFEKQRVSDLIKATAERIRALFVGTISSNLLFIEEIEEAADYVAAGYPDDMISYPHIAIESKVTGEIPSSIANKILAKKSNWILNSATIKGIYLSVVRDLANATTIEQVTLISNNAVTALNLIHP